MRARELAAIAVLSLVLITFLGCEIEDSNTAPEVDKLSDEVAKSQEVTVELQDYYGDQQKMVIWIENNSANTFSGRMSITTTGNTGRLRGQEMVSISKLPPGERTYAILWLKTNDLGVRVTYRWYDIRID